MAAGRAIVVDMNDLAVLQRPSLRARHLAARVTLQALAERAGVSYSMVQLDRPSRCLDPHGLRAVRDGPTRH
jgi:hypothetical protein